MAEDPITQIKQKLDNTKILCEELRKNIEKSDQKAATQVMGQIESKLDNIKRRLKSEFGWLSPPKIEE
jgi:5-bromo-4-chloroindolyl phosphate hydrolysis protein